MEHVVIKKDEDEQSFDGDIAFPARGQSFWAAAKPTAEKFERRQGKWTRPECEYAAILIEHFTSGRLPGCAGGESLRTTLAECLMCTPMRITKKLSSTHAIGKSCFKKKGELSARERVSLDQARASFLASVESKKSSGTEEPRQRKRSRGHDPAAAMLVPSNDVQDEWLGELNSSVWLNSEDLANHDDPGSGHSLYGGTDVVPRSVHDVPASAVKIEPSVSARYDGGRTAVRVVVADRPGLLGEISTVFKKKGLSIVGCTAETLIGDIADDEFFIVDAVTKIPVTDDFELEQIEAAVEAALKGDVLEDGAASTASKPSLTTSLRVTVPDRPGLLQQIVTSLSKQRLSIVGAKIETYDDPSLAHWGGGKTAQDVFDVVDADHGGPVLDPLRLRSIEEQLTRDLDASALSPSGVSSPPMSHSSRHSREGDQCDFDGDQDDAKSSSLSSTSSLSRQQAPQGPHASRPQPPAAAAPEWPEVQQQAVLHKSVSVTSSNLSTGVVSPAPRRGGKDLSRPQHLGAGVSAPHDGGSLASRPETFAPFASPALAAAPAFGPPFAASPFALGAAAAAEDRRASSLRDGDGDRREARGYSMDDREISYTLFTSQQFLPLDAPQQFLDAPQPFLEGGYAGTFDQRPFHQTFDAPPQQPYDANAQTFQPNFDAPFPRDAD
ncbi:hypothetical protein M885DRAFT_532052 [Pelagophyceae sp. CCMP2097]|nr:hypothetical protein M885DRAFT_532052 [Pelagophyceae sp. CCMP2097]